MIVFHNFVANASFPEFILKQSEDGSLAKQFPKKIKRSELVSAQTLKLIVKNYFSTFFSMANKMINFFIFRLNIFRVIWHEKWK